MTFENDKKTFLAKMDRSKKGEIDEKAVPVLKTFNKLNDYYTTSSCSGRVYLWSGTEKKGEMNWLKASHDLIEEDFFELGELNNKNGFDLVWLRVEPFILHVCCQNIEFANKLLTLARTIYKKSNILSIGHKIIVEIRGSEMMEMPLYLNEKLLFNGELSYLKELVNHKLNKIFLGIDKFNKELSKL